MKPFTLSQFPGGLSLPGHRSESVAEPLARAEIPARLVYLLRQRSGRLAQPRVAPGERVRRGQVLAGGGDPFDPPILAATSGHVLAIEPRPAAPAGIDSPAIVLAADGEDAAVDSAGLPDYQNHPAGELRRRIHEAGIVGLGGAAFPTAIKLEPGGRPIRTLILNGVECEPYITCDEALLRHDAPAVLAGAELLRHVLGAETGLIAIENDRPEALAAAERACLEGGFGALRVVAVPARYPAGGERQLIRTLTGIEVPSSGRPADIGVVCHNVGTAHAAHRAVVRGEPLVSRIVTVTGRGVRRPRNLEVRLGTPIADLVAQCGGYTEAAERLILGGPMMGLALATDAVPIGPAANCILVAGPGELAAPTEAQPCIRCGDCAEVCPAGLLPQQLHWHARARQLDRSLDQGLADCIECGCCDVVCPSRIPLTATFRAAKDDVRDRERERDKAAHARARFEARQARKLEEQREQAETARRRKDSLAKSASPAIQQALERAKAKRAGTPRPATTEPLDPVE